MMLNEKGFFLILICSATAAPSAPRRAPEAHFSSPRADLHGFAGFYHAFNRSYPAGSQEFAERQRIYEDNIAWIERHNKQPDRTWTAGINKLSDRLRGELAGLRGYRRNARSGRSRANAGHDSTVSMPASLGFMSRSGPKLRVEKPEPDAFTWVNKLSITKKVMDQQACGSCWAFASAATLRAHSELFQTDRTFSTQQIVSCVQNPQKCGGDGGCEGATAELALDYVKRAGCGTDDDFKYSATDITCPSNMQLEGQGQVSLVSGIAHDKEMGGESFGMTDWRQLPPNMLSPVKQALVEQGPIAVSVATYDKWNYYSSGILDTCANDNEPDQEFVVNHAVMLVGYGEGDTIGKRRLKFWEIQNSWGRDWGENGFIRIKREEDVKEAKKCGWDEDPLIGTGCTDGPSRVYVCGSCGILYDNVVPTFRLSEQGLWNTLKKAK